MSNESLLNSWTKLCLREKNLPVCLVSISDDGSPHVYTMLDKETTAEIFKHLRERAGLSVLIYTLTIMT
jgi:hypothetical protein